MKLHPEKEQRVLDLIQCANDEGTITCDITEHSYRLTVSQPNQDLFDLRWFVSRRDQSLVMENMMYCNGQLVEVSESAIDQLVRLGENLGVLAKLAQNT